MEGLRIQVASATVKAFNSAQWRSNHQIVEIAGLYYICYRRNHKSAWKIYQRRACYTYTVAARYLVAMEDMACEKANENDWRSY